MRGISILLIFMLSWRGVQADDARASLQSAGKPVVGWLEKVRVERGNIVLQAKLEASRLTSIVHAEDIREGSKGENPTVRFKLKDRFGHTGTFEAPLVRKVRLKSVKSVRELYVVQLGLCIAGRYLEDEVALSDRSQQDYEMVIGRQTLEGNFIIDPAATYSVDPGCGH